MEYNYSEIQVQPIIPKSVADEQLLVFVPVGSSAIHGIVKTSNEQFKYIDKVLTIIEATAIDGEDNGFTRSRLVYEELSERDNEIKELGLNKQDKYIAIDDIQATTVEDALIELKKGVNTNETSIVNLQKEHSSLSQSHTSLSNKVNQAENNIYALENRTIALEKDVTQHSTSISNIDAKIIQLNSKVEENNETLTSKVVQNAENIVVNTETIKQNSDDIAALKSAAYTGEHPIGTYPTGSILPADGQLTAFVKTSVNRDVLLGDSILFTQIIASGTDKSYKFLYTASGWTSYEIPPIESASNNDKGLMQGTYSLSSTLDTIVDVSDGKIVGIYVKTDAGYKNIKTIVEELDTRITNTVVKLHNIMFSLESTSDTTLTNYPCKYTANIAGVTLSNVVDVYLSAIQISEENYSSYVEVGEDKVSIFLSTTAGITEVMVPTVRIS